MAAKKQVKKKKPTAKMQKLTDQKVRPLKSTKAAPKKVSKVKLAKKTLPKTKVKSVKQAAKRLQPKAKKVPVKRKPSKKITRKSVSSLAAASRSRFNVKKLRLIGTIFILVGIAGIVPPFYYHYRDDKLRAQAANISPTPQFQLPDRPSVISGKPKELFIPSLNMRLSVVDGVYNPTTGEWTLTLDKVHFALPTVMPNNFQGNTLIYGHYRPEVFARLHKIEKGGKAEVITENGYRFYYTFREAQSTSPSDTSIFAYRGAPKLTLQTCSGAYMQNRQLFSFDFDKVEKV